MMRLKLPILVLLLTLAIPATAEDPFIIVASTTSTENSGLFAHILPLFEKKTHIQVRVIAAGTGQAIRLATSGDADVLLVHHLASEKAFVKEGHGVKRHDLMYNNFVIVGPKSNPASITMGNSAATAFTHIANTKMPFVSRGDDSGTHKKELGIWQVAGIDPRNASGSWYREAGAGMGAVLNTAAVMNAYTLSDRGTWLAFANRGDLMILNAGSSKLLNPYGVILVNQNRHPHVKAELGQKFIDWLIGPDGQKAIASFTINGEQAFFPADKKSP